MQFPVSTQSILVQSLCIKSVIKIIVNAVKTELCYMQGSIYHKDYVISSCRSRHTSVYATNPIAYAGKASTGNTPTNYMRD